MLTTYIDSWLRGFLTPGWALAVEFVLIGVAILVAYAVLALVLIWMERKVCGFFQCRVGPNRVGKWGVLQSVADMIKILLKELVRVDRADHMLFRAASFFVIVGSVCTFAALPFARGLQAVDFNVGVFYVLAVSSLGVVGILLAGWSSNSKYSMIGAMRSGAQLISYEISSGLAVMAVVVLSGSMQLSEIVEQQADGWFIFKGHVPAVIAFLIYLIAGHAETNRGPFDMPEAESELTSGYHTEYSGIQFGFFYLAEYLNMFIIAAMAATMFLGGWQPLYVPGWEGFNAAMAWIPGVVWMLGKTFVCVFLALWVRWTFPRLRIDQMLSLEWKVLMPVAIVNIILMALVVIL